MDEKKILTLMPGAAQMDVLAEGLRNYKKNADVIIEYHEIDARIKRAKFNALVKEGFSEPQALELCK